jgi:uncharacterized membrane protein YuzA (DUF378 family)
MNRPDAPAGGTQTSRDLAPRPLPDFSRTWEEGRYWDRWMIVHFFTGFVVGLSNVYWRFTPGWLLVWTLIGLLVWELLEWLKGIGESWENRVIDVVVGMLGVGLAAMIAPRLPEPVQRAAFLVGVVGNSAVCYLGWRAYRSRTRGD